ncbi:MFS transporter [Micromonospora sp. WMMD998]|uniref:MFS transporter n=1 Tax=Micromonospora sp. WMMD998 TaxID=3016092 RepID=UPI00249A73A3|nr:MFS transporter [Micromonospora sp. WMMD998]WFE42354.1 MFS transporter [Micromonospora sp. WMMD998]
MSAPNPAVSSGDPPATAPDVPVTGPSPTRWWTLAIVTAGTFMLTLDLTVVNVALPELRNTLHADFSGLQWVIDAYALTLAVFLLTGGSLADRLGGKRVFLAGLTIFTAASVACGVATDILALNLARGVQGMGAAVLYAVGPALIGREFQGRSRGAAFGIFGAGSGLAIALGPLIGGALTSGVSWRWIFLVNLPVGVVAFALGMLRMPNTPGHGARRVDWPGLASFSVALTLLVLGLLRGEQEGWSSPWIVGAFVGSAVLFAGFVLIERHRGEAAMLDLGFFRITSYRTISLAAILVASSGMSAIFLLISYVQNVLGYSPWESGLRFLPLTVALFVAAIFAGSLTARLPHRVLVAFAAACVWLGLLLFKPLVDATSDWTALLPTMVLIGVGLGAFNPPRAALSVGVVEPAKSGAASGTNVTFQQVGLALGIAGFGALFQHRVIDHLGAPDLGRAVAAGAAPQAGEAGRAAFVAGLGDVLLVSSFLALAAAVVAFGWIRDRDLHATAVAERADG